MILDLTKVILLIGIIIMNVKNARLTNKRIDSVNMRIDIVNKRIDTVKGHTDVLYRRVDLINKKLYK